MDIVINSNQGKISDEEAKINESNFISTEEVEVKSEARENSVQLSKAAEDQLKKPSSKVAQTNFNKEQPFVTHSSSSGDKQAVQTYFKTISTPTQTSSDIPDYYTISLQLAEAVDKIQELEDALDQKTKLEAQLRSTLTDYRRRAQRNKIAKENALSHLKEESNAQGQGETEVGYIDVPIAKAQTKVDSSFHRHDTKLDEVQRLSPDQMFDTEAFFDAEEHPQLEDQHRSLH
jgi:hypothetical protein